MGLWEALFPSRKTPLDELPAKIGGLQCERCQGYGLELYIVEPCWYYCAECVEGSERKKRFEAEEKDWNKK